MALLADAIVRCRRCPELRAYCRRIARDKRSAFRDDDYWGKPVPGFGDPRARLWILGLAPAAHGGNRTGRVFTGDRSGDFLFAALHRAGLCNQETSTGRDDGLRLRGIWISAALRCAPPGNRPTPAQLERCRAHLDAEWELLRRARAILCLGAIAWRAARDLLARQGLVAPPARFAHGARVRHGDRTLLASYHVSQQNTFTGRLTAAMFDAVLRAALAAAR
jgi:uracil-DNA glycosylase family 4